MIKAEGVIAFVTNEMNMIIMMMAFFTFITTERIFNGVVSSRNGMNDSLI